MTLDLDKPLVGSIYSWGRVRIDIGDPATNLGYRVAGEFAEPGGRGILTTPVVAREDDEIETLNSRYRLMGDES